MVKDVCMGTTRKKGVNRMKICGKKLKFISKCITREVFILPNGQPDWSCTVEPTIRYSRDVKCSDGHKQSYGSKNRITSFKRFANKGLCELPARRIK